ncbi:MAG: choice-of-anchor J domain-containing protein [Muribaculaceae bacterium]|nr:choice-of-anchor J domain-containing protein [Muribaculaceae bacterium]
MKKFLVLLIAAAVAVGASAGVKLTNNTKANVKDLKAMDRQSMMFKKGDAKVMPSIQLNAFESFITKSNHALKDGDTYFWDFEDEAQVNDWVVLDEDGDGFNWELISGDGITTHSGAYVMSSASYDNPTYTALTPDNWLVSPWLPLHGKFGFYACGQDPSYAAEVFGVYIYTSANSEWVQLGEDITATGVMKAYEFDLSEYEGLEGSIAIVHHNVTDMFRLNVDDITIGDFEAEPEPEMPTVITEIPENCEVNTYWRSTGYIASSFFGVSAGYTDGTFKIAIDPETNEAYIQNPVWWVDSYNSWVKGEYDPETGIITIPTGQYLMWSDAYGYGIILGWGSTYAYTEGDEDGDGEDDYYLGSELDDRATEIQFQIDGDKVYLLNGEGNLDADFPDWASATGMFAYYSDDLSFVSIEFANNEEAIGTVKTPAVAAVPADPTADEWYDCGDESGFSKFYFTLPTTDVDGNILDPEFISYALWINDGEGNVYQYTFPAEVYTFDLVEDIDEVPYELYTSAVDFNNYYVYMYRTNENDNPLFVRDDDHDGNIGIQVFYTVDGEKNASNIVWLYEVPSSVNEMNAGKTVANVRYFNVAGQEMAQPSGMTIKVTTYTDGTTSAVKVVK